MSSIGRLWCRIRYILVLIFLLAGCGNPVSPGAQNEQSPSRAAAQNNPSSEREIAHAMGTTSVPAQPQRIIVLDNGALDNVLALGVVPVGAATVLDDGAFPAYLQEKAKGITPVGTIDQPNLELILRLKPDLILGSKDTHEPVYDKLSAIAPTVFVESLGTTWNANLQKQAEALGKQAEGQRLLDDYQTRVTLFQQRMGDTLKQTTVSVIRSRPDKISLYLKQSFIGTILEDVGLPRPPAQDKDAFSEDITTELLTKADASVIFWTQRDPKKSHLLEVMKNPLWAQLSAVKQGRVYEVSHETWISGLGITAVHRILDDLFAHLTTAP